MRTKEIRQQETETVFGKTNYIVLLLGSILIITGYILMSGEGSTLTAYNPDIFSTLRIRVAPIVCLAGYLINVYGIIYVSKSMRKKE